MTDTNNSIADINKIKACVLGHAVADALGVPVEFTSRAERDKDPVTDMRGFGTYGVPAGSWSDWGDFTPFGSAFNIGRTSSMAISAYKKDKNPLCSGQLA